MSTALRHGPQRVYFHSHEPNEPPHVHVDRDDASAKLWLRPVRMARNIGFAAAESRHIVRLIAERESMLLEAWDEHFGR